MERWLADFDPLAALEAEYAAVLAQSNPSRSAPSAESAPSSADDEAHGHSGQEDEEDEDDDDDALDDGSGYAPLPSSPMGSDDGGLLSFGHDDAAEVQAPEGSNPSNQATAHDQAMTTTPAPMDDRIKHEIMTSMQRLRLPTPPWAASADALSDQELIELVQRRLRSCSVSRQAASQALPTHDDDDAVDAGDAGDDDKRPLAAHVA